MCHMLDITLVHLTCTITVVILPIILTIVSREMAEMSHANSYQALGSCGGQRLQPSNSEEEEV